MQMDRIRLHRQRWWWIAVLALPVIELGAHAAIRADVPSLTEWRAAAEHVRGEHRPGDLVTVAPTWADPVLRLVIGDAISLADAGRSDLHGYERLWVVSIRGASSEEAPDRDADHRSEHGGVTVERWDLDGPAVLHDFVESVRNAEVEWVRDGAPRRCAWRRGGPAARGLGGGAATPGSRFMCPGAPGWLWVGPTVTEDLDLHPRRCVYQHPFGSEPVRTTFRDVPIGDTLLFYGGLYYEAERERRHGQVDARVYVAGELVGHMSHHDGDGWKRMEIDPRSSPGSADLTRADVTIETTAPNPHMRMFCWSAKMLGGAE